VSGTIDEDDHHNARLLSEVALSYEFPCKSFLKMSPMIMLVATITCILTALSIRSYTPNDGSSNDYSVLYDNVLADARCGEQSEERSDEFEMTAETHSKDVCILHSCTVLY